MRAGDQRFKRRQVNGDHPLVLRIRVRAQRSVIFSPALRLQESEGLFIGGEDRGGRPQFCPHVGDRRAFRYSKRFHSRPAPFDDVTDAALDAEDPQDLQADVLRRDEGSQRSGQLYPDHGRHIDIVSAATHGDRHVQPARSEGQHPDAACRGGVAVGADQSFPGDAEALQMHLMADSVSRAGIPDPVLCRNRLNIPVVIRVLKA